MKEYLQETKSIDYMNPHIQEKVQELKDQSCNDADYIKRVYIFVRDEIPHSWDIQTNIVSRTASDALINKTGICWAKSLVIPKGTKIFYIERITSTRRDYEVLFNRGTELKFHNQENEYVSSWILI